MQQRIRHAQERAAREQRDAQEAELLLQPRAQPSFQPHPEFNFLKEATKQQEAFLNARSELSKLSLEELRQRAKAARAAADANRHPLARVRMLAETSTLNARIALQVDTVASRLYDSLIAHLKAGQLDLAGKSPKAFFRGTRRLDIEHNIHMLAKFIVQDRHRHRLLTAPLPPVTMSFEQAQALVKLPRFHFSVEAKGKLWFGEFPL